MLGLGLGLGLGLVWVEGGLSCAEFEVGVEALSEDEVEVEGATRVEGRSVIAMLCEVGWREEGQLS